MHGLLTGAAIAGYTVAGQLAGLLSSFLFNSVYVATLATFNQSVFFLGAGFDVMALLFLG